MRSALAERELMTEGGMDSATFGIARGQEAHIMGILRSNLYSRKALAVLREYSSNGWDAHRMFGKSDIPIKITLPTFNDPTFKCQDFGPGLSRQDVLCVYTQYGASTKRETNDAVGALGIGSKSAFCLGDSFTITSRHGGEKAVYVAALDASNKGKMTLLHAESCGDETGIEIKVAVPVTMVPEFAREAQYLLRYMRPQPVINKVVLEPLPDGLEGGFLHVNSQGGWIGVMGCVPYRIDMDRIRGALVDAGLESTLQGLSGGIYLPIGEVDFAASREEIQYTDKSKAAIVTAFECLIDDYVRTALSTLKSGKGTGWDLRNKAMFIAKGLGIPLPKEYQVWAAERVTLWGTGSRPEHFSLPHNTSREIPVSTFTRVLIRPKKDTRAMSGWDVRKWDVVVVPKITSTDEDVRAELDDLLVDAKLDGIGIGSLTERAWYPPNKPNDVRVNAKHQQHTFRLVQAKVGGPHSDNWEKTDPPTEDHVYVIINRFLVGGSPLFYSQAGHDQNTARYFGLDFPETIYGYKTTKARPITPEDITLGTPYDLWRLGFFKPLMTGKVQAEIRTIAWAGLFQHMAHRLTYTGDSARSFKESVPGIITTLAAALGEKHMVTRYFKMHLMGVDSCRKMSGRRLTQLKRLAGMFRGQKRRSPPEYALDRILTRYPMMGVWASHDRDLYVFRTHLDTLIKYITDIDGAQS